jgi:hypothetical protein
MRPADLLVLILGVAAMPANATATELSPALRRTAYCAGVMKARMQLSRHGLSLHPDMREAVQPGIQGYSASYRALLKSLQGAGVLDAPAVHEAGLRAAADMAYCAAQSSNCRDPSCPTITADPRCAAILDCDATGAG